MQYCENIVHHKKSLKFQFFKNAVKKSKSITIHLILEIRLPHHYKKCI